MIKEILRVLAIITGWPVQLIFFSRKTYYEDKKSQGRRVKGGAIIISNHTSIMDYMVNLFIFPFRKLYCLIAEVIYKKGFFMRFLVNCMGGIKVDRFSKDLGFIDEGVAVLKKGKLLQIFPEGRISNDKKLLPFTPSYILIALRSGAPIIPVVTDGNYGLFKRVHVLIGKKIYLSDYCKSTNPTKEELEKINKIISRKIALLRNTLQEKIDQDKCKFGLLSKLAWDFGRLFAFTFNFGFRIKVFNKGIKKRNLKIKGRYIIVANHEAFLDPIKLICVFWRRRVRILTAEAVFSNKKFRSFMMERIGCVKIDRNKNDIESFKKCLNILKNEEVLIIFPEGHLSKDGTLDAFKSGAVLMAALTNTPILPVYMQKRKKSTMRSKVYLGEPIKIDIPNNGMASINQLDEYSHRLYQAITELKEKYGENNYE